MKITYWSDYACPYCYIGEARLKKAIETLGMKDEVEIEMKSFELDRAAPKKVASSTTERFAEKYGLSEKMAADQIHQISELGKAEGIDFRYASTLYTNTMDAHRLTKMARSKGDSALVNHVIDALFDAYFTKNLELSDKKTLIKIATESGMDATEVEAMLDSEAYQDEVRQDEREAGKYGIHAVPFFIVGDKHSISGAQSVEGFLQILSKVSEEESSKEAGQQGMACGSDGCHIG